MREHARVRVSSIEYTDLDGVKILWCYHLRGNTVPATAIRAEIEALPTGIDITRICTESNTDSRLEGRIAACHAQRVAPAANGKHVSLCTTGVDILRNIYVRCSRLARQPQRIAANGIRQAIHRAVGHDTIQRGRAHTVARHLPLLRKQARRRCRGVVRRQVENAIRPFVVGRKGWLFSDTPQGAEASAIIYSLMETAKANSLRLDDYLLHLLSILPERAERNKDIEIDDLLPWSEEMKSWFSAV